MTVSLLKGFADAVADAGDAFRAVLQALSRPGTVHKIAAPSEHPERMSSAAASVLLALPDHTTPVWLDPSLAETDIDTYLRFHSGAPVTSTPEAAVFALIARGTAAFDLGAFPIGTSEYPDRSATVLVEVAAFNDGPSVDLRGPGIEESRRFAVQGVPVGFWDAMVANNNRFPLGVDVVLTSGDTVAALPRSTRIEVL